MENLAIPLPQRTLWCSSVLSPNPRSWRSPAGQNLRSLGLSPSVWRTPTSALGWLWDPAELLQLRILAAGESVGLSAGRNAAVRAAQCPFPRPWHLNRRCSWRRLRWRFHLHLTGWEIGTCQQEKYHISPQNCICWWQTALGVTVG